MAANPLDALKKAPAQKRVKQTKKEPETYVFRLVAEHPLYHDGAAAFPPMFQLPNTDTILWNYGTDEDPDFAPRRIRYVDGVNSVFIDEQEERGELPEHLLSAQANTIVFNNGFLRVPSWNKNLVQFLLINNQCEQNTRKMKQVNNLYKMLDFSNSDNDAVELGAKKDKAYDLARSASEEDMIPHAKFLGISFIHPATGMERDLDAIREDYKSKALENPEQFLLYSSNPKVKTQFLIQKGIEKGVITTGLVMGQLHWAATKQFVTEYDTSKKTIDALVDFANSALGESFLKTLKTQL